MGIDNKYLIFKNIQPGLTVAEAATVDSVLLKLHSMGITFNLKADDWAVNVSANSLDLISQSSAVVEIVITRTVDLSDLEFETLSYLKIKNRFGQALYLEPTASTTDFKSFMIYNISSIGYYEFGFGMRKIDCYKFNSENVLNNKIFPYDFVNSIDKDNLSATENINQDITLPDGGVIHKDYVNNYIKYQTIPRYNIGTDNNKQSMKLSVFKENVSKNSNDKNFIFNSAVHYEGFGDSTNAKYWASYPEIYPEIIFNTTRSTDFNEYDMKIESATNKITIIKNANNTTISYDFNPATDELILYVREPGTWKATKRFDGSDYNKAWKIQTIHDDIQLIEDSNTATLTLDDIKLYDISNFKKDFITGINSFLGDEENRISKTNAKYNLYSKVVKTPREVTIKNFPSLEKPARDTYANFAFGIGKYDTRSGRLLADPNFQMKVSIKGYQLVSYENRDSINLEITTDRDYSEVNILGLGERPEVESYFNKYIISDIGLLPIRMAYYGDCNYRHNLSATGVSYQQLIVNEMDYEFHTHDERASYFDSILKLNIGYITDYYDDAVALVVWHNTKE